MNTPAAISTKSLVLKNEYRELFFCECAPRSAAVLIYALEGVSLAARKFATVVFSERPSFDTTGSQAQFDGSFVSLSVSEWEQLSAWLDCVFGEAQP